VLLQRCWLLPQLMDQGVTTMAHTMVLTMLHTMVIRDITNRQATMPHIHKLHTPNILCRDCLSDAGHN